MVKANYFSTKAQRLKTGKAISPTAIPSTTKVGIIPPLLGRVVVATTAEVGVGVVVAVTVGVTVASGVGVGVVVVVPIVKIKVTEPEPEVNRTL